MTDGKRIETEVIDPDSPVKFLRLSVDGDEMALIPWDEAEAVAEAVIRDSSPGTLLADVVGDDDDQPVLQGQRW